MIALLKIVIFSVTIMCANAACDALGMLAPAQTYTTCAQGAGTDQSKACACMNTYIASLEQFIKDCPTMASSLTATLDLQKQALAALSCGAVVTPTEAVVTPTEAVVTPTEAAVTPSAAAVAPSAAAVAPSAAAVAPSAAAVAPSADGTAVCSVMGMSAPAQTYATCVQDAGIDQSKLCACMNTYIASLEQFIKDCPAMASSLTSTLDIQKQALAAMACSEDSGANMVTYSFAMIFGFFSAVYFSS